MPLYIVEDAMKIITERKEEMKGKGQETKGDNKMKKMVMAILVAVVLVNAGSAFAYLKAPAGIGLTDPAPSPFKNNLF